jgi:predicted nucleic acid-binding Zn ribbon protein
MFYPIQKLLPRAMAKLGVRREVEAAVVCEKYRKLAPRLIHTNALDHTFPKFYQKKTLTIGVENPAWAQQVMSQKKDLIKAINESIGKEQVENLKTIVAEHLPEIH